MKKNGKRKLNEYKKYVKKKKNKENEELNESEDDKENNNENENEENNKKKRKRSKKNNNNKKKEKKIDQNNSIIRISQESVGLFYKYIPNAKNNNKKETIIEKKDENSQKNDNEEKAQDKNQEIIINESNNETNSINENKEEEEEKEENNKKKNNVDEFLLSCLYDLFEGYDEILIKPETNKQYVINASIKIDVDRKIKFEIVYDKERDYFDYYPDNNNFVFEGEDEPFNYDLDIPKEDFSLLIKNFKKFKIK